MYINKKKKQKMKLNNVLCQYNNLGLILNQFFTKYEKGFNFNLKAKPLYF